MRITKVEIINYKALRDIKMPLENLSILIGQNDAGKTSVLNAIDAFFNKKKLEAAEWNNKNTDKPIEIILSFAGVPPEDVTTPDGCITIRKTFDAPDTTFSASYSHTENGDSSSVTAEIKKYFFDGNRFIFIPVKRDIDDQFNLSIQRSMLRRILDAKMTQSLEAGGGVSKSIQNIKDLLKEAITEPQKGIEKCLREQLKDNSIQLSFSEPDLEPLKGISLSATISDSTSQNIRLQDRGAGTQNNAIIALFRYTAATDINIIFGMEEPENSLHPKAQRQLLGAIQEISDSTQVIVTTHSPVFIDRSRYESNILMTMSPKGNTEARVFKNLKDEYVREELGIKVSDALLAGGGNCAILVEGQTENESFPVFMEMMGLDYINLGISIVPMNGNSSKRCLPLLGLLGSYDIPCVVVFDDDNKDVKKYSRQLREKMEDSSLPNLKEIFLWEKGSLEDYYPPDIVLKAIEKGRGKPLEQKDKDKVMQSTREGIGKYGEHLNSKYNLNNERLKSFIGSYGTKIMRDEGNDTPADIQKVLKYVEKIARRDEN